MKQVVLCFLKIYQKIFTLFSYGSCRYYPTCSEYAKWQIQYNSLFRAFLAIVLRILRCNKLFVGGIDYPIIKRNKLKKPNLLINSCFENKILFWFIRAGEDTFYVIKSF